MFALHNSPLQRSVRLVAFEVLVRGCSSPTRPVMFEALSSLAGRVGLSVRTVRSAIRRLEVLGLLERDTEGPPHGGAYALPTRYRVRVEALELLAVDRSPPVQLDADPLPEALRRRSFPPTVQVPPGTAMRARTLQLPAADAQGTAMEASTPPGRRLAVANARLAAAGLASDASPFESACAAIYRATRSQYRGNLEALVRALGPETAHDLARAVERRVEGGSVRHPAAVLVGIVKRDHPDAWVRYQAGARRYGTRANRVRMRGPGPLDLPVVKPSPELKRTP